MNEQKDKLIMQMIEKMRQLTPEERKQIISDVEKARSQYLNQSSEAH